VLDSSLLNENLNDCYTFSIPSSKTNDRPTNSEQGISTSDAVVVRFAHSHFARRAMGMIGGQACVLIDKYVNRFGIFFINSVLSVSFEKKNTVPAERGEISPSAFLFFMRSSEAPTAPANVPLNRCHSYIFFKQTQCLSRYLLVLAMLSRRMQKS
jgi:hypothetical protein